MVVPLQAVVAQILLLVREEQALLCLHERRSCPWTGWKQLPCALPWCQPLHSMILHEQAAGAGLLQQAHGEAKGAGHCGCFE